MVTNPDLYRKLIDALVRECRDGQGQIGARRARSGVWNANATPDFIEDQHAINELLKRLDASDREVIAGMLANSFRGGVFNTLRILHDESIPPFEDGYEGSPYEDFAGRMSGDWEWPQR